MGEAHNTTDTNASADDPQKCGCIAESRARFSVLHPSTIGNSTMYTSTNQRMTAPENWGFDSRGQRACFTSPRDARKAADAGSVCGGTPTSRKRGGKRK